MAKAGNIAGFWKKAKGEAKKGGFGEAVPVEAGAYNMQFFHAEIGDFGDARKVMMCFSVLDEGDDRGKVCKCWEGLDEDRLVWLIRMLMSMGVDVDDVECETEDDLQEIFDKLAADNTVVSVKVTQKDGWTNMRVKKVVDVDSSELFDAEELAKALKEGESGGGKSSKDDDKPTKPAKGAKAEKAEEPEEMAIAEGDVVKFKHPKTKKATEGEIVGFDDDDNPKVLVEGEKKPIVVPAEDVLEVVTPADDSSGGGETKEHEVDDVVYVTHKKKEVRGLVTKVKGDDVFVKIKGEDSPVKFAKDDVRTEAA